MKYYLTISMLFLVILLHGGDRIDSLFIQAGEEYSEGRFEQALVTYQEILDHGFEAADLYYNMGNAAFRSNKLGYAVLYYEKALKLDPSHEAAKKNRNYVSRYKEDQLERVPELFIRTWIRAIYQLFSLQGWSSIAITLFALMLAGVLGYIFSPVLALKKAGFFTGLAALLLFVLSLTAAINRHSDFTSPDSAVIVYPSVVVKSTPSLSGTDLFVLHEGTKLKMGEEVSGWIEITISDGRVGWIPAESLAVI